MGLPQLLPQAISSRVSLTPEVDAIDADKDGNFNPCRSGVPAERSDYYNVHLEVEDSDLPLHPQETNYRACEDDPSINEILRGYGLSGISGPMGELSLLARGVDLFRELAIKLNDVEEGIGETTPQQVKEDEDRAAQYALLLGARGVRRAIPLLRMVLNSGFSKRVIGNAVWALQSLGDPEFITEAYRKYRAPIVDAAIGRDKGRYESIDSIRYVHNIPCLGEVVYSANGGISKAALAKDYTFENGVKLKSGTVFGMSDKDKLSYAAIDAEHVIQKIIFPANTFLYFNDDGTLDFAEPGGDCTVQGVEYKADANLWFDARGRVAFARLNEGQAVGGIPVKEGTFAAFDEEGGLERAVLGADKEILGYTCKNGTEIEVNKEGSFSCRLSKDVDKGGFVMQGDEEVTISDGKPMGFVLKEDRIIDGVSCRGGEDVLLRPDGKLLSAVLKEPHDIGGIVFNAGTRIFMLGKSSLDAYLASDQSIQEVPCKAGSVATVREGKLTSFTLSKDHAVSGIDFQGGTVVTLTPGGKIKSAENRLNDFSILSLRFKAGAYVPFHETGKVMQGVLAEDQFVDGIPCKGGELIVFHKSGSIKSSVLAKDWSIHQNILGAGTVLEFNKNGTLTQLHGNGKKIVDGIEYGRIADFYPDGGVKLGILSKDQTIDGVPCGAGQIQLHDNGKLARCYTNAEHKIDDAIACAPGGVSHLADGTFGGCNLSKDALIQDVLCKEGMPVSFREGGRLFTCVLDSDQTFEGVPCRGGSWVYFHENGKLAEGIAAAGQTIEGKPYAAGERFRTLPFWQEEKETTHLLISDEIKREEKDKGEKYSPLTKALWLTRHGAASFLKMELYKKRKQGIIGDVASVDLYEPDTVETVNRYSVNYFLHIVAVDVLKNIWPLDDCDCEAGVKAELFWTTENNRFRAGYKDIGMNDISVTCPKCPFHTLGLHAYLWGDVLHKLFTWNPSPLVKGEVFTDEYLNAEVNIQIKNDISDIYGLPDTVEGSAYVKDVWIERDKDPEVESNDAGFLVKYGYKIKVYKKK